MDRLLGNPDGTSEKLITYVADRKGHDLRYAIDSNKLKKELGWEPSLQFEEGIEKTVRWYLENNEWMENIASGAVSYTQLCTAVGADEGRILLFPEIHVQDHNVRLNNI